MTKCNHNLCRKCFLKIEKKKCNQCDDEINNILYRIKMSKKEINEFTKNLSDKEMKEINEQILIRTQTDQIPYELNLDRPKIISAWTEENILKDSNNSNQNEGVSTMNMTVLNKAAQIILDFFLKDDFKFKILDIMSGNLAASSIMFTYFISNLGKESNNKIEQWILTDGCCRI